MIAGHAFLAFSLVGIIAYLWGKEPEKCLYIGFFAGLFALVPDIDIVFAWKEILVVFTSSLSGFVDAFWATSDNFHRGITHSLITLSLGTAGFGFHYIRDSMDSAVVTFALLTVFGLITAGMQSAMIMMVFAFAGITITGYAREYIEFREFMAALSTGLIVHPFGDIFTGAPPEFLYPFNVILLESRVWLNQDPVLNLLSIFFLEMTTVVIGIAILIRFKGYSLRSLFHPVSLLGLTFFFGYQYIPDPTLSVSYQFVFSAVGFGVINTGLFYLIKHRRANKFEEMEILSIGLNMVITVLTAAIAFSLAYLVR